MSKTSLIFACIAVIVCTDSCGFNDDPVVRDGPDAVFAETVLEPAELVLRKRLTDVNADGFILAMPSAVVVAADSSIYVADWASKQIVRYADDFRFIASFGGPGEGPAEFRDITSFTLLDDEVIVYDEMSRRLTVLSKPEGAYLREYATNDEYSLWPRHMLKSEVIDSAYYSLYKMPNFRPGGRPVEASSYLLHTFKLGQEKPLRMSIPYSLVVGSDSSTFTDLVYQGNPGFIAASQGRVCYAPFYADFALYCHDEAGGDAIARLTGPSNIWPLQENVSIEGEMPSSTTREDVPSRARMISFGGSKYVGVVHNENIGLVSDSIVQRRKLELEGTMFETAVASSFSTMSVVSAHEASRTIMFRDLVGADIVEYGW